MIRDEDCNAILTTIATDLSVLEHQLLIDCISIKVQDIALHFLCIRENIQISPCH